MSSSTRPSTFPEYLRAILPPLLVIAGAVGYLAIDYWVDELPESVPGMVPPLVHAGLVTLQAVALMWRRRSPIAVFSVVVLLDLVILVTTAGELGIGALGVVFAAYTVARHGSRRSMPTALGAGAIGTTVVGGVAMVLGSEEPPLVLLLTAVARIVLLYAIPWVVAEYVRGRERLTDALREQARLTEWERRDRAEREIRAERTALARELHDIAGHHLSGIIVSAQAATALTRSDPERARAMMQTVQDDARTTLADLRRTVGLLRSDDDQGSSGRPSPVPSITGISALVDAARARGQRVDYVVTGETPRSLGPFAETAAYRMVQESLANAARHAPGVASHVSVQFGPDAVELLVRNEPGVDRSAREAAHPTGYGLSGMAERAALIGARLTSSPTEDGGWGNRLTILTDGRRDT